MRIFISSVITATIILLTSACSSNNSDQENDLVLMDNYSRNKLTVITAEFLNPNGTFGVQATIKNITDRKIIFEYRFQWFTKDGQFIDSPTASWIPITLDPNDTYEAMGVQVSHDAIRPKLSIKKY
jgi:uncharacterized protein YcfL